MRQVADRLVFDLAALAIRAAQQRGLVLLPLVVATGRRHVNLATSFRHRAIVSHMMVSVKTFSVYNFGVMKA